LHQRHFGRLVQGLARPVSALISLGS
jgi:hypothetical protein